MECKQCKSPFEITDRDKAYYKRISVPEPTHCPSCRMQRRFTHRNERRLYHRKCDLTGRQIISMYPTDTPFPVFDQTAWWGDKWEAIQYGQDFDFNRPFFEQFAELQKKVPRVALLNMNRVNSEYCNFTGDVKNSYLIFGSIYSEDCYYGSPYYSKDCVDTLVVRECEECYECTDCRKLYNSYYCQDCVNGDNLLFCYDLQGCSECIGSVGLRKKKYHIFNKEYSKEEYEKKKAELDLCNPRQREALRHKMEELKLKIPRKFMQTSNAENVSGDHVHNSKNTHYSFFADKCEDCSYCAQVVDLKDCYDNNYTEENELCYEYIGMYATRSTFFSSFCRHTDNTYYSEYCTNSKNLFGCNGIRDKEYCILNKQYLKEEYEKLKTRIIEHMKKTGEWGEFFPVTTSPFAYNESVAQEYFPLTKEQALGNGWRWSDFEELKTYKGPEYEIPENIDDVKEGITKEILLCEVTGKPYKLIPQELKFYQKHHLPIPRRSPDQRHRDRLALRNPRKLWDRTCDSCSVSLQSTFAPDRPEKVYCEACYLKKIY